MSGRKNYKIGSHFSFLLCIVQFLADKEMCHRLESANINNWNEMLYTSDNKTLSGNNVH